MAPATTSTSLPPVQTVPANDLTDFVTTIGSAVGPLLTLFGEQATKQFLSMSLGWADNILLAMGPIGIITVIISAVRIGGYRWIQGTVGRARESRISAEQEFLSSTSEEVCELWSGRQIVRVAGKPNDMKDIVIVHSKTSDDHDKFQAVTDLAGAHNEGLLTVQPELERDEIKAMSSEAPNIALNVPGAILSLRELRIWTLMGVILQLFALIFPALATYYFKWLRKGVAIPSYAYWSFLSGTLAIIIGLLICGHVVEGSTIEHKFEAKKKDNEKIVRILRVQMDCNVSSQHFPSVVILNGSETTLLRSRLKDKQYKFWSTAASLLAVLGFVVQFIGLSALHYSATAIVLVVSLIMTAVRAYVRIGLTTDPKCIPIPEKSAIAWLVRRAINDDWMDYVGPDTHKEYQTLFRDCGWGIPTGFSLPRLKDGTSICDPELQARLNNESNKFKETLTKTAKLIRDLRTPPTENETLCLGFYSGFATVETPSYDPELQCVEIRAVSDLLSTAPNVTSGEYSGLALKLATAMVGTISVLRNTDDIVWNTDSPLVQNVKNSWGIGIQQGPKARTSWFLQGFKGSDTDKTLLTSELAWGITLWMHSLICMSKVLKGLHDLDERHELDNSELEILTPGQQGRFLRIVGSAKSSEASETASELQDWMRRTSSKAELVITDARYDGDWREHADGETLTWPVFGLYYSASLVMESEERSLRTPFTFRSSSAPVDRSAEKDIIATKFNPTSIETECALEIFSLFMLSICKDIKQVCGGKTKLRAGRPVNPLFEALSEQIVSAGLVNRKQSARLYIIPPFAKLGLLPT